MIEAAFSMVANINAHRLISLLRQKQHIRCQKHRSYDSSIPCSQIIAHANAAYHPGAEAKGSVMHCLWTVYITVICDKAAACLLLLMCAKDCLLVLPVVTDRVMYDADEGPGHCRQHES